MNVPVVPAPPFSLRPGPMPPLNFADSPEEKLRRVQMMIGAHRAGSLISVVCVGGRGSEPVSVTAAGGDSVVMLLSGLNGYHLVFRWIERCIGQTDDVAHSHASTVVHVLASLWHSVPVLDDITDLWLLWVTFGDNHRGLWWNCFCVFVIAEIERAFTALFFLALILRMTLSGACFCFDFAALDVSTLAGQRVEILPNPGICCWTRCCGPCSVHALDLVRSCAPLGWLGIHRDKSCSGLALASTPST